MRHPALVAACLVVAACAGPSIEATQANWLIPSPFVGFSISPPEQSGEGFVDFFERASVNGDLVAWVGAWQELSVGGTLVVEQVEEHGYIPVVVTGFPTEDGVRVLPDDMGTMVAAVSDWVADHPVPFLGVGVEINTFLWERAPEDFERFAETFPDLVEEVHAVSPATRVFPIFQLERLRGLKSGLFGEEDTEAEWERIDRFPTADLIGFTSYPGLIYPHPDDLPDDYYQEVADRIDRPIAFTEVGWQAGGELGQWSGSPDKQAAFVADRLPELSRLAEMVIWSFLWDQPAPPPFETMGLIGPDGERAAMTEWEEVFG